MSGGAFAEWQPRYAEVGIATFPVNGKTPAVRGYLQLKPRGSIRLIERFPNASAFGLALKPSHIAVVDVDTPDERVLADALACHGDTPFIVRSGSGHFQAWYRRQNEGRYIRPNPVVPIDILGDGFVVAPPSTGEKGQYQIIQGALADLPALPRLLNLPRTRELHAVEEGRRNDTLWRHCMRQARHCDDFEAMLDVARSANASYIPPLQDAEVFTTAKSAWSYLARGRNWFSSGKTVVASHKEVDGLLYHHPDAFVLLAILRRHHWGREFVVANEMAAHMPGCGWSRKRLAEARRHLVEIGQLEMIRPAIKGIGPAFFRFRVVDFDHQ